MVLISTEILLMGGAVIAKASLSFGNKLEAKIVIKCPLLEEKNMNLSRVVRSPRRFSLRQSKFIPAKHTKRHTFNSDSDKFRRPSSISKSFVGC